MPTYTSFATPSPFAPKGSLFKPPSTTNSLLKATSSLGATTARPAPSVNVQRPTSDPFAPPPPTRAPGNNLTNPGLGEQAFNYTQSRLLEDPAQGQLQNQYNQTQTGQPGEQYLNQNLGTLDGPGQGDQYWNQVSGQFQNPFAGEQFARQATQNFAANGPASAFYNQAMGQYGNFTGYSGPQNTQGQYGQSSASLANGTQGEQGLGAIAGQYGSMGQYNDPNLAAGQYAQTQGAFGAMPVANFDPFYDRASQLATQDYNRQAAGRGVYGSSEALSGVGNVITDIEAQRANRSFDAEMQRAQEQRARQQLLGEQARMGDLSSLAAFGANLSGAETFGNLQNMRGNLELNRNELLGNMANAADTQALGAHNANIAGLEAFGNLSNNADVNQTRRFEARTNAMNNADRTALDRMQTGANIANQVDTGNREDFRASTSAAQAAANLGDQRIRTGADIASRASQNDLARLEAFNNTAQGAESQRQARQISKLNSMQGMTQQVVNTVSNGLNAFLASGQDDWENWFNANMAQSLQAAGLDQQQIDAIRQDLGTAAGLAATGKTGKKG